MHNECFLLGWGNCFKNSIYQVIQSDVFLFPSYRGHQQPFKIVCMYTYIYIYYIYIPGNSADDFFRESVKTTTLLKG